MLHICKSVLRSVCPYPVSPGLPHPAYTSGPHPGGHQLLLQWCHSRAALQLPTALTCLAMGPIEPDPPVGPCPRTVPACPCFQEDVWCLGLPRCPLAGSMGGASAARFCYAYSMRTPAASHLLPQPREPPDDNVPWQSAPTMSTP